MILTLEIHKQASGVYLAAAMQGGVEVTEPTIYSCIEDAITEETAAVPAGFAHFIEARYSGFSSGTLTLEEAPRRAKEVADRLVGLVAQRHTIEGR